MPHFTKNAHRKPQGAAKQASKSAPKKDGVTKKQALQQVQQQQQQVVTVHAEGNVVAAAAAVALPVVETTATIPATNNAQANQDDITTFRCPSVLFDASGIMQAKWLLPKQVIDIDTVVAVRNNEKYEDVEAIFNGERHYVRAAMMRAGKIFLYLCPGKNTIMVMCNFAFQPWTATQNSRLIDGIRNRTVVVQPFKSKTIQVPFKSPESIVRLAVLTKETPALMKVAQDLKFEVSAREGHVPDTHIITAVLNKVGVEKIREMVSSMPLSYITSSKNAKKQLTVRSKVEVSTEKLLQTCINIQRTIPGAHAIMQTFRTIRIALPHDVQLKHLKQFRSMLDLNPNNTVAFADDMPAQERVTIDDDERLNVNIPAQGPTALLLANHLPTRREFEQVAKHLNATIVILGSSKFTDCVMSCVIAFPKETDEAKMQELFDSKIETEMGSWYINPRTPVPTAA